MKAKSILPSTIVISILLAQITFAALPRYEIIDLSTQGCGYSIPYAINDIGQVAGFSHDCEGGAFFWDRRNGMIDLGVLYEGDMSAAYGVNDHGQVVGFSGPDDRDAFIWDSENSMRCPEGFGSEARAINNAGQVVVNTEFHSYLWHPNEVVIVLGSLGADRTMAYAINIAGQVVGNAYTSHSEYHAFLWDRATGMRDLGTLGGTRSMAFGINDTGQVVGMSRTTTGDWHAFLWNSDTGMVDLGEGRALAINNAGQVVGNLSDYGPAFYWDRDNGLIQLSDLLPGYSGWVELESAEAINNRGQIVGCGFIKADLRIHAFLMTPVPPKTIYVDNDATGASDGSSWADAYNYLQDALAAAYSGDEIWVAQGIYTPDSNSADPNGSGDREATFQLINGVTLKGGYAGEGTQDPNARNIELYETILSGDLDGNDVTVNDPEDLLDEPTRAENSYHVLTGTSTDQTAVLVGFVITGGNANGYYPHNRGGAMYNYDGSPTLANCMFSSNSAGNVGIGGGGGMYNYDSSSPMLVNCTFSNNLADDYGGGMYNKNFSSPTLTNCIFSNNSTDGSGGGMHNEYYCNPTLTNCIVNDNSAGHGGGMHNYNLCNPTLANCTFSRNSALSSSNALGGGMYNSKSNPNLIKCNFSGNLSLRKGGGMFICGNSIPTFTNCIFYGNSSDYQGGGLYITFSSPILTNCTFSNNSANYRGGGIFIESDCYLGLTNCIIWQNTPQEIYDHFVNTVDITYSNIRGYWLGEGNIDTNPCFVRPGYWDANGLWVDGDYHLLPGSPCIDAGDPNYVPEPNETDLDGRPRVIGGRIDMGAYETPIFAEARILPRTINLASKGKWLTCYIQFPGQYNIADIEPNSVFLEGEINPHRFWLTEDQQIAVAKFTREDVQSILDIGEVELTITGRLTDGIVFEGADTIKVIDKAGKKSAK